MLEDEEEDVLAPKEPQVSANNPEERKAARANRIKRRQEALKRAEAPREEVVAVEELGIVEQATTNAAEELQRLTLDGVAKVTNVKVTTDEREVFRRNECAEKMRALLSIIEEEAEETELAYEAVSTNWEKMLAIKDPLDIDAAMKEQKVKCDELLEKKNFLINQLRVNLKDMDVAYYEDLEKQDKDIKELSDRIDKQIMIMAKAYDKQISLIEDALNMDRESMVEYNHKRWEALYKQRDKEELLHIDLKYEQLEEHKQRIEDIMWEHNEKYRQAKIELETLLQELQKELEKLKATCIINTEKIGYTYQVLKKREEENVFVRSQQKRKLNKMSDVANALRAKIRKTAEESAIEEIRADEEIVKLIEAMKALERKSYHFAHVNDVKFMQVWRMSAARCVELMKQLRQAEVSLHAHVLSEPPPPPPTCVPKSPFKKDDPDKPEMSVITKPKEEEDDDVKASKDKLVRHILQLVADNTGFLVEDRLLKLIEKYQQKSKNLCTLDAIFMALEIQAQEDIELLCDTFLTYAFCPVCVGLDDMMADTTDATSDADTARQRGSDLSPDDQLLLADAEELIQKCGDPQAPAQIVGAMADSAAQRRTTTTTRGVTVVTQLNVASVNQNPFICAEGHDLEIEPMQVLTALSEFISKFVPPEKQMLYDILNGVKPPDFSTPSRLLKEEDIAQYWSGWKSIFPVEKDRFWDGMIVGLTNFLRTLQEREKLHDEVSTLRARNRALRGMVRGVLPTVPPPRPHYLRHGRSVFTTAREDFSPDTIKLPPLKNKHCPKRCNEF